MSLADIRQAIIDDLAEQGLGDAVTAHPGRLTADELKTFPIKGRAAVLVGCLGFPTVDDSVHKPALILTFAVYVIALDKPAAPRDVTAMGLASAVALRVVRNLWGRSDLADPSDIRADNLYSGTIEKRAVALWAVTFRQAWTPESIDIKTLDDLLTVETDFDVDLTSDGEPILTDIVKFCVEAPLTEPTSTETENQV